jgi:hypothetical protein
MPQIRVGTARIGIKPSITPMMPNTKAVTAMPLPFLATMMTWGSAFRGAAS